MIVYHGTSARRANRICAEGFVPKKPSRRVWFAESRGYASIRAKTQARRTRDRPVVLTCYLDLNTIRKRFGSRRVFHRSGVIAIDARVPVSVLRSHPGAGEAPTSPEELAAWVNQILGLKPYKGVNRSHPGIDRLSRWVVNRITSQPGSALRLKELLEVARRWLPDFFAGVEIDPETLRVYRRVSTIEVEVEPPTEPLDAAEEEALECLVSEKPRRRVRGLRLLAEMEVPDLFDWCVMFLEEESVEVTVAALRAMVCCEEAAPEVIVPFADSTDKRVRAAATAALAKHGGKAASYWFERGLKDPEPCVRAETAALLGELHPALHKQIFELALFDPNPEVARRARKLTAGKGYPKGWLDAAAKPAAKN
jgi:hypothetical protein